MSLLLWLTHWFRRKSPKTPSTSLRVRPRLETLENRIVPVSNLWANSNVTIVHDGVVVHPATAPLWSISLNWLQYNDPTAATLHHIPGPDDYLQFQPAPGSPNSSVVGGAFVVDRIKGGKGTFTVFFGICRKIP